MIWPGEFLDTELRHLDENAVRMMSSVPAVVMDGAGSIPSGLRSRQLLLDVCAHAGREIWTV